MTVTWAVWLVPLVLLAFGTPIYLCFLAGGVLIVTLVGMPPVLVPQVMFGSLELFTLMSIPFFLYRRRADGAQRHRRPPDPLGDGAVPRRARRARARDRRRRHRLRGDFGRDGRDRRDRRPHHVSGPAAERLRRAILARPHHRDRRHRRADPAQHPDGALRGRRRAIDRQAVHRRHRARPAARRRAGRLCDVVRARATRYRSPNTRRSREIAAPRSTRAGRCRSRSSFSAASTPGSSRRPRLPASPA